MARNEPEHGPIYLFSFSCTDSAGRLQVNSNVTRQHPILKIRDWHARYPTDNFQLISYQVVEQIGDLELQRYLDWCITENYGELS